MRSVRRSPCCEVMKLDHKRKIDVCAKRLRHTAKYLKTAANPNFKVASRLANYLSAFSKKHATGNSFNGTIITYYANRNPTKPLIALPQQHQLLQESPRDCSSSNPQLYPPSPRNRRLGTRHSPPVAPHPTKASGDQSTSMTYL